MLWRTCGCQSIAELRSANITGVQIKDIHSAEEPIGLSMDQIIVKAMGGIDGKIKVVEALKTVNGSDTPSAP